MDHGNAWESGEVSLPGMANLHNGRATLRPGETYGTRINVSSNGAPLSNVGMCDVIDITTTKFSSMDGAVLYDNAANSVAGMHAYVLRYTNDVAANIAYQADSTRPTPCAPRRQTGTSWAPARRRHCGSRSSRATPSTAARTPAS